MLYRKFVHRIEDFLLNEPHKILLVNGARQIGKSYLIRYVGKKIFRNYVEINLKEDSEGMRIFADVKTTNDFYMQLGALAGNRLGRKENTLVFLDEIQSYPHLMTMLKFLNQESRYTYIASGSQLGVALAQTASVPIGSIAIDEMYPLDFEEFLLAMGCGEETIEGIRQKFIAGEALNESLHNYMLQQFKLYLLVGGMPEAINKFLENRNIAHVRNIHRDIHALYRVDASQYDKDKKLVIRKIYDLIPSNMENKKKRIVVKRIETTAGHKQFSDYADEFEYLTNSGIVLSVQAISNPKFPLLESQSKNLLKLYLNDVGLLTYLLYGNNINAVLKDENSVNLGSVYESVVAQELHSHGFPLHYYDNKQKGEVDFLVDNYTNLTVLPLEIKSGKDYTVHSALDNFINTSDYNIHNAVVLSNAREVYQKDGITYQPIYYCMFYQLDNSLNSNDFIIPEIKLSETEG
ncbi:MAG: ATP-binding protein [Bacteroidales bacterium]|nr:ATP-binding protein [Bacteroidales bacterium]